MELSVAYKGETIESLGTTNQPQYLTGAGNNWPFKVANKMWEIHEFGDGFGFLNWVRERKQRREKELVKVNDPKAGKSFGTLIDCLVKKAGWEQGVYRLLYTPWMRVKSSWKYTGFEVCGYGKKKTSKVPSRKNSTLKSRFFRQLIKAPKLPFNWYINTFNLKVCLY